MHPPVLPAHGPYLSFNSLPSRASLSMLDLAGSAAIARSDDFNITAIDSWMLTANPISYLQRSHFLLGRVISVSLGYPGESFQRSPGYAHFPLVPRPLLLWVANQEVT